ncbi:lytic murein transglycosylase [Roseomonas gilardii subsp. gilardii]|uniref:lytic murein transglycosylase n=1 Tax=Roseomonas gilardii TaxID=257708 RepID=UPI001FFB7E3F|nr:lytic murein transglycosylase [Roseomonas gilardii]UPG71521.1 lytic murein transglycosylase [Roseomonas gilardii subsp. gilardii]
MPATRRALLSALAAAGASASSLAPFRAQAQEESFASFLQGLRAEARRSGVSDATLNRALNGLRPNDKVIELDRKQPEFTMTWAQYRDGRLSQTRIDRGRQMVAENLALLQDIERRFNVSARVVVAIWGLETNYGAYTGNFNTVEALATLAWEGRRAKFFRGELIAALKILDAGHVSVDRMRGSYAGAMGQPQFMPSSFNRLAVDFDGDGRKDIWDDRADALGSIANYLAKSGWEGGVLWGREVVLPAGLKRGDLGRDNRKPLGEWARLGVRKADGSALPNFDQDAAIVVPGDDGQAFMVYRNFNAIRRYNPSDFYALAVGMLSDRVA